MPDETPPRHESSARVRSFLGKYFSGRFAVIRGRGVWPLIASPPDAAAAGLFLEIVHEGQRGIDQPTGAERIGRVHSRTVRHVRAISVVRAQRDGAQLIAGTDAGKGSDPNSHT